MKHCKILIKEENYIPESIAFDCFEQSNSTNSNKLKIVLKYYEEPAETGNFRSFRQFLSQVKARLSSETEIYPIKKPTGQGLQLLLNRSRVLIHENF